VAACEVLFETTFAGRGRAAGIAAQPLALVGSPPNHVKVALWCYREAAEVHTHRGGRLAGCLPTGQGVKRDPAQAVV